jgi:hypothetical protein
MANKWLAHVRKTMKLKKNKGKPFGAVLKSAKKTYKARGGERITAPDVDIPVPVTVPMKDEYNLVKPTEGGRRRRSRHTRK